jgi:D-threonate/D-erythronate kinase
MIVVADDLTGAAEIAGICLRYGLKIHFTLNASTQAMPADAEVCIISTDTRSMPLPKAVDFTRDLCNNLKVFRDLMLYKKTDSALRGHVLAELKTMQNALGYSSVLCIPVNPPNGRIIRNENYYIGNLPIHETSFSKDPDFPARTSNVNKLLNSDDGNVFTGAVNIKSLPRGFILPDISCDEELFPFLSLLSNHQILPAGGGYFFNAFLLSKGYKVREPLLKISENTGKWLMVCGSTHHDSKLFIRKMKKEGVEVIEMTEVFSKIAQMGTHDENFWIHRALRALEKDHKLIVTIASDDSLSKDSPEYLKARLAQRVKTLLKNTSVEHLFVEGGATALAVAEKLGIDELVPVREWQQGVVQMKTNLKSPVYFTLKPGSYPWPESMIKPDPEKRHP